MLDSHPDIAIPPETGFLAQAEAAPDGGADEFVRYLESVDAWPDFHLASEVLLTRLSAMPNFDRSDAYRAFYAAYAARFSKSRYGDKTPMYVFHMRKIQELLPEAAFIHIVRDGRDVALSLEKQWFSPGKGMAAQARLWADFVGAARNSAGHVSRYLEIKFEDLVLATESTLSRICQFIEVDFAPVMLSYYERTPIRLQEHEGRNLSNGFILSKRDRINQQIRTTQPPQSDLVFGWRRRLSPEQINDFEQVAGHTLRELGYELDRND
jgi:hypothetical protein